MNAERWARIKPIFGLFARSVPVAWARSISPNAPTGNSKNR